MHWPNYVVLKVHTLGHSGMEMFAWCHRDGFRISGKGVNIYTCIGVWGGLFAEFILHFLNIPWMLNNLVSQRPYYLFIIFLLGYLKRGVGGGSSEPPEPPLDPPLGPYHHHAVVFLRSVVVLVFH